MSPDAAPAATEVTATVVQATGAVPLANAQVCIVDHAEIPCAHTDGSGSYTIALPAWTTTLPIAINITATGYLGFTGLVTEGPVGVTWIDQVPLRTTADATTLLATQAGFTYPASGKAFVMLSIFHQSGGAYVGATATLSPASGFGPVYVAADGTPTPSLTAVSTDGYLLFGGLTPGRLEITVGSGACTPVALAAEAWSDTKPSTIAGETSPDSMTQMAIICE